MSESFLIRGATVFDGRDIIAGADVLVRSGTITAVGPGTTAPPGADVIDGTGAFLMPGLIDAHTHAQPPSLELAIAFGVTTEFDMFSQPEWMDAQRRDAAVRDDMADVRSASVGVTVRDGHPSMMIGRYFREQYPVVAGVDEIPAFVAARVAEGADYIKLLIDDGGAHGHPTPTLTPEMSTAVVRAAHEHGLMAVAHAMTLGGAQQALDSGVDGIVHSFVDTAPTQRIVDAIAAAGVFVIPTLVTMGALTGEVGGEEVAHDARTDGLLTQDWRENLCAHWGNENESRFGWATSLVRMLDGAGVDVLAGTDACSVGVYGTAHGVSLHHELRLLVAAGLEPIDALRAATSVPARRFGLHDRGEIRPGRQADLVLIGGNPLTAIADTLSIREVWRRGNRLDRAAYRGRVAAHDLTVAARDRPGPVAR